jgi:sugar fermentation stimulation protein A
VKSVTLVTGGKALFPDAPTVRGRKHLESLTWARREGYAAAVVFVIQREDVEAFSPNDAIDADFGSALREAKRHGVDIYAYRCKVSPKEIELADQVAIHL